MNLRWLLCSVCSGLCFLSARAAVAQATADGFALDRFEPSERGSEWFSTDSLDLRSDQRPAVGVVFDYARDPLVLYEPNGDRANAPVHDQLFGHAGGSVVLAERVRLALSMPVLLWQTGDGVVSGNELVKAATTTTIGDIRVGLDVRLLGAYRKPFSAAIGAQVAVPTGSQSSYASDGSARLSPHLLVAGEASAFVYALALGYTYRHNDESFVGVARGSEFTGAASLGLRVLDGRMVVGPEVFGSSLASDVSPRRNTPVELIFGTHVLASSALRIGAGAGPGLTRGLGSPAWRGLLSIEWIQPLAKAPVASNDPDLDGVPNPEDACPNLAGIRTADAETTGCPKSDQDGDGISDREDACRDEPGIASADPVSNGCPDRDSDGIFDKLDACPEIAGAKSEDPKLHGCPEPRDGDGDGALDPVDACPNSAGPANDDPKKNGCPIAHLESGQIRIREQLQFGYNSAKILRASDAVLEGILDILERNPDLQINVEGHTDDRGSALFNKRLSQRRAQAAVVWLVKHGIPRSRLKARGFGEEQPLSANDSDEAREGNRRVEFHVVEGGEGPSR